MEYVTYLQKNVCFGYYRSPIHMAVTANCISAMTPPANVAPPKVLTPMTDWACVFCAAELGGLFPGGAADRGLVPPVPNEKASRVVHGAQLACPARQGRAQHEGGHLRRLAAQDAGSVQRGGQRLRAGVSQEQRGVGRRGCHGGGQRRRGRRHRDAEGRPGGRGDGHRGPGRGQHGRRVPEGVGPKRRNLRGAQSPGRRGELRLDGPRVRGGDNAHHVERGRNLLHNKHYCHYSGRGLLQGRKEEKSKDHQADRVHLVWAILKGYREELYSPSTQGR
jgi:hypothetical protein